MHPHRTVRIAAALVALAVLAAAAPAATTRKALIVDGQNNHTWESTTPVMKEILEAGGLFAVDVATSPPKGKPMAGFRPAFAKYDVIVSNYNGAEWPAETKDAFVKYISGGGGLVIVHAADNSFSRWKEYNEMIGLGGWGGRNEKSGPYLYWKDGKYVRDTSKGRGGTHGRQTPYLVEHRDTEHPITKGLPARWMHCKDELYAKLRGPAKNVTVLATAYSDPKTRGTGRHEPALFTIRYGKGRVFHTVLGHAAPQMRCVGFIVTLRRGTEWAATGKVTRTKVPPDFPTGTKVSVRPAPAKLAEGARGPAGARGPEGEEAYAAVAAYKQGDSRKHLAAIEQRIRGASPQALAAVETRLLAVLGDPKATFDARQWVCRVLRQIGTARSVPALAKLLADEKLSHMARFALQQMPCEQAGAALRAALGTLDGTLRIGVIGSLGQRRDRRAVARLATLAADADQATAAAAISALGAVGGPDATGALAALRAPKPLRDVWADAYLRCADSLARAGKDADAAAIYRALLAEGRPTMIRIAALRGICLTETDQAAGRLLRLMKDRDVRLQRAAGKFMADLPGEGASAALARALPTLAPPAQVVLLSTLTARGHKVAAPAVARCAQSRDEAVRLAAVQALGVLGDASHVALLARQAAAGGDVARAARASLVRLAGDGAGAAIVRAITSDLPPAARAQMIEVATARRERAAMDAVLRATGDPAAEVRRAAFKAIGLLGGEKELPRIVAMLIDPANKARRGDFERALGSVIARVESTDAGAAVVLDALAKAGAAAKANLLGVLPRLGGAKALAAARGQLRSPDRDVKRAALRALSNWPDAAPMGDLLRAARGDPDPTNQVLALRGYVKMLSVPANRSAAETVRMLGDALKIAKRPQEKKAVLSALPKFPCEAGLRLAKSLMMDEELSGEASLAARKIQTALVRREMTATAQPSGGGDKPANALDGKDTTRWSTGRPMKPGDWFAVDLGREAKVRSIELDTRRSSKDYPRGYEVFVSFDGKSWGKPALVGKGDKPVTKLVLKQPVACRHVKIVQTGSTKSWNWSIHTLKIDME